LGSEQDPETGGVPVTVAVAEALALPPEPVQERENSLDLVNVPVDSLPESALLPDQAPEATQEVASLDDQVSVDALPLATEGGFADSDTVGSGGAGTGEEESPPLPPHPMTRNDIAVTAATARTRKTQS